ncbi:MAG: lipid-A-disaccharide synthase N-terminal domain-containing protein [Methylacidiphilaceae bacterium]|nr:lipid-A-disaccharide synthase N-terminal domain-containing protein [Candidatus Methylacidiphilaceae bacterium]
MSGLFLADGSWLGVHWGIMKIIGWAGNLLFFSRFVIQWLASERKKAVVVPLAFWYCSLGGSLLLLIYALSRRDSVFVFAYLFTWIPYIRNLSFAHRERRLETAAPVVPLTPSSKTESTAPPAGR